MIEFDSNRVKVFPSQERDDSFDRMARFVTDTNLSSLVEGLTSKDGFILKGCNLSGNKLTATDGIHAIWLGGVLFNITGDITIPTTRNNDSALENGDYLIFLVDKQVGVDDYPRGKIGVLNTIGGDGDGDKYKGIKLSVFPNNQLESDSQRYLKVAKYNGQGWETLSEAYHKYESKDITIDPSKPVDEPREATSEQSLEQYLKHNSVIDDGGLTKETGKELNRLKVKRASHSDIVASTQEGIEDGVLVLDETRGYLLRGESGKEPKKFKPVVTDTVHGFASKLPSASNDTLIETGEYRLYGDSWLESGGTIKEVRLDVEKKTAWKIRQKQGEFDFVDIVSCDNIAPSPDNTLAHATMDVMADINIGKAESTNGKDKRKLNVGGEIKCEGLTSSRTILPTATDSGVSIGASDQKFKYGYFSDWVWAGSIKAQQTPTSYDNQNEILGNLYINGKLTTSEIDARNNPMSCGVATVGTIKATDVSSIGGDDQNEIVGNLQIGGKLTTKEITAIGDISASNHTISGKKLIAGIDGIASAGNIATSGTISSTNADGTNSISGLLSVSKGIASAGNISASNHTISGKKLIAGIDGIESSGNISASGKTITASTFSGKATTASKLATARNLKVNLSTTVSASFDGSENRESIGISGTLGVANGGTGATNGGNACANIGAVPISGGKMTGTFEGNGSANLGTTDAAKKFNNAYFKGTVEASTFNAQSDRRLKSNIEPIKAKDISKVRTYEFDKKDCNDRQVGVMAQELQENFPELVVKGDDGMLSVKESKLVYYLMDEVRRLTKRIEELESLKKD